MRKDYVRFVVLTAVHEACTNCVVLHTKLNANIACGATIPACITSFAFLLMIQRDMDILLASILDNGRNLVEAERCSIFFVDEERGELWTKVATDRHGAIKVRGYSSQVYIIVILF